MPMCSIFISLQINDFQHFALVAGTRRDLSQRPLHAIQFNHGGDSTQSI